jgi:hypothetical protein
MFSYSFSMPLLMLYVIMLALDMLKSAERRRACAGRWPVPVGGAGAGGGAGAASVGVLALALRRRRPRLRRRQRSTQRSTGPGSSRSPPPAAVRHAIPCHVSCRHVCTRSEAGNRLSVIDCLGRPPSVASQSMLGICTPAMCLRLHMDGYVLYIVLKIDHIASIIAGPTPPLPPPASHFHAWLRGMPTIQCAVLVRHRDDPPHSWAAAEAGATVSSMHLCAGGR